MYILSYITVLLHHLLVHEEGLYNQIGLKSSNNTLRCNEHQLKAIIYLTTLTSNLPNSRKSIKHFIYLNALCLNITKYFFTYAHEGL